MNKDWLIGAIAVVIVAAIIGIQVFLSSLTPNYDWTETYSIKSDQPYGLSGVYDLVSEKNGFKKANRSVGESLNDSISGTYMIISDEIYMWDKHTDSLLNWVAKGNQAFFSLNEIPWFLDSITGYNLDSALRYYYSDSAEISLHESIDADSTVYFYQHRVVNDTVPRNWHYISDSSYYWEVDSIFDIQSLGRYYHGHNFFRIPLGEGEIFVHTEPILFTNYYLFTDRGFKYANLVFSQLDDEPIYWDNYHHIYHYEGEEYDSNEAEEGVLKIFFSNRGFKVMWVVMILGILLFLVFRGKREQRIIPLIHYPENTSKDYAHALGALYHRTGEPKYIASEMITMFHNHNRRKYHIQYKVGDETYAANLAKRAKVNEQLIKDILSQERKIIYNDMAKMRDIIGFYELLNIYYKSSK